MNFKKSGTTLIIIILICLVIGFIYACNTKEHYGGKIKNIKKIPFNDAARIAQTYLKKCLEDNKYAEPGLCYNMFGPQGWMVSEAYYSNYQRM